MKPEPVPTDETRRSLLRYAVSGLVTCAPIIGCASNRDRLARSVDPFTLGVASGEPRPDGFIAWTRLAPEPMNDDPQTPGGMSGGDVDLMLEIALDDSMQSLVQRIKVTAEARYAYSVHAEVVGLLPNRPYWYRFRLGDALSTVGRARTAPLASDDNARFDLGFVSCSNFEHGHFSAYRHLAEEQPDAVLFLGDYIYEGITKQDKGPVVRAHSAGKAPRSLAAYRLRHSQYRCDPDLQRLHATAAALITWDDHEVQNDYADRWSETFDAPETFLKRRAAAYQAFYEHMPLSPRRSRPQGPAMRVYDRFRFGRLFEVSMLDGRQYRSREACYGRPKKGGAHLELPAECPELFERERTLLGEQQERWLYDGLSTSQTTWNILGQDVLMAQFKERLTEGEGAGKVGFWTDDWNGYPANRHRLLEHIEASQVRNPVVLSGDIHSFWANDLKRDFDDPASKTIATEFVGTSITSHPPPHDLFVSYLPDNPHVKFFDARRRGYANLSVSPGRVDVAFRAISDPIDPRASVSTLKRFIVEEGHPGVQAA